MKLIGFDLDGTLLDCDKRVSEYTKRVLGEAAELGWLLVPVTGRPILGVSREVLTLPGAKYAVASNGAVLYQTEGTGFGNFKELNTYKNFPKKGEVSDIWSNRIPISIVAEIFERVNELHEDELIFEIFIDGEGFVSSKNFKKLTDKFDGTYLGPYIHASRHPVEDFSALLNNLKAENSCEVDEISLIMDDLDLRDRIRKILEEYTSLNYVMVGKADLEVINNNAGKWNALEYIAKINNIPNEDIIAFGDGNNDLSMLENAGVGFVMKNSPSVLLIQTLFSEAANKASEDGHLLIANELSQKCVTSEDGLKKRCITEFTNEEDGVSREIKKMILS
jgi:HAD superfamily hydrolase (TIGR01484 family)